MSEPFDPGLQHGSLQAAEKRTARTPLPAAHHLADRLPRFPPILLSPLAPDRAALGPGGASAIHDVRAHRARRPCCVRLRSHSQNRKEQRMNRAPVIIRVDATPRTGFERLARSMTLAAAL